MLCYLWPDGDYQCTEDDSEPFSWKSDDFVEIEVPGEEDIDDYMHQMHLEINLGQTCETKTLC
jgi:hypothetical protein